MDKSSAFARGFTLSRMMKLDTCLDFDHILKFEKKKIPPENENLKKRWPAKIKHGWIPQTWKPDCYALSVVRVCHFAKEDFKRDLQVYEYWSW